MKFLVPINEVEDGGSQTVHVVETNSTCARTNKRKLRAYFVEQGVPVKRLKYVMKAMGFTGDTLGDTRTGCDKSIKGSTED